MRWRVLGNISLGWITTPVIAAVVCFVALFFLQNVFNQKVYREVHIALSPLVMERLVQRAFPAEDLADFENREFHSATAFLSAIGERTYLTGYQERRILDISEMADIYIAPEILDTLEPNWLTTDQIAALQGLAGRRFRFKWAVAEELAGGSAEWRLLPDTTVNKHANKDLRSKLEFVYRTFAVEP